MNRKQHQAFLSHKEQASPLIPKTITANETLDTIDMGQFLSAYNRGLNHSDNSPQADTIYKTVEEMDGNKNGKLDRDEIEQHQTKLNAWLKELGATDNRDGSMSISNTELNNFIEAQETAIETEIKTLSEKLNEKVTLKESVEETITDRDELAKLDEKADKTDEDNQKITELSNKLKEAATKEKSEAQLKALEDEIKALKEKIKELESELETFKSNCETPIQIKQGKYSYTGLPSKDDAFETYMDVAVNSGLNKSVYDLITPKELERYYEQGKLQPSLNAGFNQFMENTFDNSNENVAIWGEALRITQPKFAKAINAYNLGIGNDKAYLPVYIGKSLQVSGSQQMGTEHSDSYLFSTELEQKYIYGFGNKKWDGWSTWALGWTNPWTFNDQKISKTDVERANAETSSTFYPEPTTGNKRKTMEALEKE